MAKGQQHRSAWPKTPSRRRLGTGRTRGRTGWSGYEENRVIVHSCAQKRRGNFAHTFFEKHVLSTEHEDRSNASSFLSPVAPRHWRLAAQISPRRTFKTCRTGTVSPHNEDAALLLNAAQHQGTTINPLQQRHIRAENNPLQHNSTINPDVSLLERIDGGVVRPEGINRT